jgi:hypothetical protein
MLTQKEPKESQREGSIGLSTRNLAGDPARNLAGDPASSGRVATNVVTHHHFTYSDLLVSRKFAPLTFDISRDWDSLHLRAYAEIR